ncbi:hypothetical protein WH96_06850 [Kiloniella spongiae]|uniref:Nickel ABC transporter substrate-binding protein n=1 Tax=Kiloniella spongiae TaxID=1489064 RepID=A0A0H2MG57_9PROT|nr:DUF4198 domain-containing protein [Kiloniella spongiae]KLN61358.1 hypothetical protein WH96_06850 [Kiloniella spongiae]
MIKILPALLLTLLPTASFAHGIWITDRFGEPSIIYGHGASDDAYQTEKLKSVQIHMPDGTVSKGETRETDSYIKLKIPQKTQAVTATFDNGYWTKDAKGKWHNLKKSHVENPVSAGHYFKYTTHIPAGAIALEKPLGLPLEIYPLQNPHNFEQGDKLSLRVLLNNKPAEGLEVIADYINDEAAEKLITDKNGEVTITIKNQELNVIAVSTTKELEDKTDADKEGYFSTLSFALEHKHH